MIHLLRGFLREISSHYLVVEASQVGYQVFVPIHIHTSLPPLNEELLLHTSFVVREASMTLYGFLKKEERDLFEMMLGISQVGPKIALNLIGHLPLADLYAAAYQEKAELLTKVPGIGKKSAERLIIEIRHRLDKLDLKGASQLSQEVQECSDAITALNHLGYSRENARRAVMEAMKEVGSSDLSKLISSSLKRLG